MKPKSGKPDNGATGGAKGATPAATAKPAADAAADAAAAAVRGRDYYPYEESGEDEDGVRWKRGAKAAAMAGGGRYMNGMGIRIANDLRDSFFAIN